MEGRRLTRLCLKWTGATLLLAVLTVVVLLAAAAVYASRVPSPIIRFVAERTQRTIHVDGAFEANLFTLHPTVVAERVTIGNPPWMPAGTTATLDRVTVEYDLSSPGRGVSIRRLELKGAVLHLLRDANGYSNWQWTAPGHGGGRGPPIIHSLSVPEARVELDDARQHLRFRGVASAADAGVGPGAVPALQIRGAGDLNGRPATFAINGDALAHLQPRQRYRFAFEERSGDTRLRGRGFLPQAFDFRFIETGFEAEGGNLHDVFFLTGVNLPATGAYRLSGNLARRPRHLELNNLAVTTGKSDVGGRVTIEFPHGHGHGHVVADLHSELLRAADIGARSATGAPDTGQRQRLVPDTRLPIRAIRRGDAAIHFQARVLALGHVSLQAVTAQLTIEGGLLTLHSFDARLAEGKVAVRGHIDATNALPATDVDVRITDLQLNQLKRAGTASGPFDGPLRARATLAGRGGSLRELASTASGELTAVLPHGALRASLAELTGLDLTRELGLMMTRTREDAELRCGVASFKAQDGLLTAQRLLVDTEPILITGEGRIHLDSEALELTLRGRPKSLRLMRLRSPISIGGTLASPSFGVDARYSAGQVAGAVALGVLLTPLASVLAFVDPGLAKDADCSQLVAQADMAGVPPQGARALRDRSR